MTPSALLLEARSLGASDVHLTVGSRPVVRVDGRLRPLEQHPFVQDDTIRRLVAPRLAPADRERLGAAAEIDLGLEDGGGGPVRCHVFRQRGRLAVACRLLPGRVPALETLGLPAGVTDLARVSRGLVLVTGPTGSGKSTTLAAMLDRLLDERAVHVLTVEDPVEYRHHSRRGLVTQREVGSDTDSFATALRAALRADPDVVMVGELRDPNTAEEALRVAETGHLTFSSLHTDSAARTVTRLLGLFPDAAPAGVRARLAEVLEGVVSQVLVPRADGRGRAVASEVLRSTPAVRHLIREGKVHQLPGAIEAGAAHGMQTLTQSLLRLRDAGTITGEAALERSAPASPNPGARGRETAGAAAGRPTRRGALDRGQGWG